MPPASERTAPPSAQQRTGSIALGIFLAAGTLLTFGCFFPSFSGNHNVEAPPFLAMLNPELYTRDFYVQEARQHFSPRTYSELVLYAFSRLGCSLELSHAILYMITLGSLSAGLWAIGRQLSAHWLGPAVFTFWALLVTGTSLGDTRLVMNTPLPSVYALGFVVWGIYFCLRKKWVAAMAFFGTGCAFHFLVALLPSVLTMPFMLRDLLRQRRWLSLLLAFFAMGCGASAVFVPMYLQGATASRLLSNEEFVFLYAFVRSPHHCLPRAWPAVDWIDAATFFAGGLACTARVRESKLKWIPFVVVPIVGVFLFLNYLFVQVIPLAIVAKLQFARMVPYATLAIVIALTLLLNELAKSRQYLIAGVLIAAPLMPFGGVLLLLLALGLPALTKALEHIPGSVQAISSAVCVLIMFAYAGSGQPNELTRELRLTWEAAAALLAVTVAVGFLWRIEGPKRLILAGALMAVSLAAVIAALLQPESTFSNIRLRNMPQDEISALAAAYEKRTPPSALILIPPALSQFRFLSRRSVVVDARARPFTDAGILEWKKRMEDVLGTPLRPNMWAVVDKQYLARPPTELLKVAQIYRATHVLTHREFQQQVPGKTALTEGEWVIWEVPEAADSR
ncbi:MAG TPA: DUF6798 domain-containing protein [Planctomycetota bacterium]|nr:DUF6798 domain-containing protein [Planctomycetota bacterium]